MENNFIHPPLKSVNITLAMIVQNCVRVKVPPSRLICEFELACRNRPCQGDGLCEGPWSNLGLSGVVVTIPYN